MRFKLEYKVNDELSHYVLQKDTITIGKLPSNDIQLKDSTVSRNHCRIVKSGTGYVIIDSQSTNGTFVNGKQINEIDLNPGDNIAIGRTDITYNQVADEHDYYETDDQKISMMIPLAEFKKERQDKQESIELKFLKEVSLFSQELTTTTNIDDIF